MLYQIYQVNWLCQDLYPLRALSRFKDCLPEAHILFPSELDLSRFGAAPSARLGHLTFESHRAFPSQS